MWSIVIQEMRMVQAGPEPKHKRSFHEIVPPWISAIAAVAAAVIAFAAFFVGRVTAPAVLTAPTTRPPTIGSTTTSSPTAASTAPPSADSYTTAAPFPLCDPNGAQWVLISLQAAGSTACSPGNTPIDIPAGGTGFATVAGFPHLTIAGTNTVTVTGTLPGGAGYHNRCLGVVEGSAAAGYFSSICNNGEWFVYKVADLGAPGTSVGQQVATGNFPFGANQPYSVAMAVAPGSITVTISLAASSNSPLVNKVNVLAFTPSVVGIGYSVGDPTIPINRSDFYGRVNQFEYADGV